MSKVVSNDHRSSDRPRPSWLRGFVPTCLGHAFRIPYSAFAIHAVPRCDTRKKMYLQNEPI